MGTRRDESAAKEATISRDDGPPRKKRKEALPLSEDVQSLMRTWMMEAIRLGETMRPRTAPNPWVGAVVVYQNRIVGRGVHHGRGTLHSEAQAVKDVEEDIAWHEATMVTTLEPCLPGPLKLTPSCAEMIVKKGIKRVIVAVDDPDPTYGKGNDWLRSQGIEVISGVCEQEARFSLRAYLHQRIHKRPFVVLKVAASMDGCVACKDGTSQWITKADARNDAQLHLRCGSNAILVGSGTALKDNPRLTARVDNKIVNENLLRVVLDRSGRLEKMPSLHIFDGSAKTLVFSEKAMTLPNADVVQTCKLSEILLELGRRGVIQVMVEGGGVIHGEFLTNDLVDELWMYTGATILGSSAMRWAQAPLASTIGDARFWTLRCIRQLGNDVCCEYERRPIS
eukprot:GEMP01050503.1.p1 GENE.GEMP01050503.1~~GEMP01050503.1.p1  ORF type:complete len:405 (+),score=70.75 GEMP01050503.1:31-1215(+)